MIRKHGPVGSFSTSALVGTVVFEVDEIFFHVDAYAFHELHFELPNPFPRNLERLAKLGQGSWLLGEDAFVQDSSIPLPERFRKLFDLAEKDLTKFTGTDGGF